MAPEGNQLKVAGCAPIGHVEPLEEFHFLEPGPKKIFVQQNTRMFIWIFELDELVGVGPLKINWHFSSANITFSITNFEMSLNSCFPDIRHRRQNISASSSSSADQASPGSSRRSCDRLQAAAARAACFAVVLRLNTPRLRNCGDDDEDDGRCWVSISLLLRLSSRKPGRGQNE